MLNSIKSTEVWTTWVIHTWSLSMARSRQLIPSGVKCVSPGVTSICHQLIDGFVIFYCSAVMASCTRCMRIPMVSTFLEIFLLLILRLLRNLLYLYLLKLCPKICTAIVLATIVIALQSLLVILIGIRRFNCLQRQRLITTGGSFKGCNDYYRFAELGPKSRALIWDYTLYIKLEQDTWQPPKTIKVNLLSIAVLDHSRNIISNLIRVLVSSRMALVIEYSQCGS